ncbi:MFS transporter [Actinoallomurus acanthiterrae]
MIGNNVQPPGTMATPRTGGVLLCMSACTVLVIGFVAAINLAVPQLAAGGLHPTSAQLSWIVDAYVVFFACLVIPAGAAGDRYGRKGVLLCGLIVFALGAVVSATAPEVPVMLLGRAVTGLGAACVLPNSLAVLIHATPAPRRPHAIAVWAAMSGIGGVVGNLGGGALLALGSWRVLFAAVAPIALACTGWVALATPRTDRHSRDLGPLAATLLTVATLALLVGIIQGPDQGWSSATVITGFTAAAVLFGLWAVVELRARHPLLDPRLLRIPELRAACLGMLVMFFGAYGLFFLNASLLQYGRGFSVLRAGLGIVPLTIPLLVGSRFVPALVTRVGVLGTLAAAFLLTSAALFGLADTATDPYLPYACWLVLFGVGVMLAVPCLTAEITAALPREQAGVGAGLQSTTREMGSALGVAVVGTLLTARFVAGLPHAVRAAGHVPHTVADALAVTAPHYHHAVIDSFTAGSAAALRIMSLIVLAAGAVVIAQLLWSSGRRNITPTESARPAGPARTASDPSGPAVDAVVEQPN